MWGAASKPNDAKISSDIQSKFSQDSGLASKQLKVQAEGGVVTLSGNVDNDSQREAAGRQAASVAGVKTVINDLQVGSAATNTAALEAPEIMTSPKASPSSAPPAEKPKAGAAKKISKSRTAADSNAAANSVGYSIASQASGRTTAGSRNPSASTSRQYRGADASSTTGAEEAHYRPRNAADSAVDRPDRQREESDGRQLPCDA